MHQEFRQITEPSVFYQQIFRRGLLQRNNFPLHFLSWTKTPFKWMAFAHSLWPQLAVLLPTLVLWSQNRQTEDEGRWRGLTQQVHTWNNCNYCIPPSHHLAWRSRFILICFISFYSPPMCLLSGMSRKSVTKTIFDSLVWFNEDHWRSEKHCRPRIVNTKLELDNTDFQKNDYIGLDWRWMDGWMDVLWKRYDGELQ